MQNKELSFQKEVLQKTNATKDKLITIIGHDLKQPGLTFRGISKKVNYLIEANDTDKLKALGEELDSSSLGLNKLLENLLNWVLVQKNTIVIRPISIDIQLALTEIVALFQPAASKKDIRITSEIELTNMDFMLDPTSFRLIISNLLDNAIKFSYQGSSILIKVEEINEDISISIIDYGVGMNKTQLNELFELSRTKSTDGTLDEKGTGLGLNLVNDLVRLNEAKMTYESQPEKGTTFTIYFNNTSVPKNL